MITTTLAIDLGKFNSVLCWYEPTTRSVQVPRPPFYSIPR